MTKNTFNGFASEEQYEAVLEIIKNKIDNYCYYFMVEYGYDDVTTYENVIITVDDYVVYITPSDGVYKATFSDTTATESEIFVMKMIDNISDKIFNTIRETEVECKAYNK